MSFLVASGHVEVTANTRKAKDDIQDVVDSMRRLGSEGGRAMDRFARRADEAGRTLGRLKAMAGDIRVRADLDDRTGTGFNSMRVAIRELRNSSPVRLRAEFDGPVTSLAATAQAMRSLREDTTRAGAPMDNLATRSAAAAVALHALEGAAEGASRSLRTLRGRAAATAEAMRELRDTTARASTALNSFSNRATAADARLTALSGNTRRLRRDMDDLDGSVRRVGPGMNGLRGSLGSTSSSAADTGGVLDKLKGAAISLAPALVPIAAALVPIAAGAVAAGAGIGALAAAAAGQVKTMTEAAEAQTKYDKAVKEHGKRSAEAVKAELEFQRQVKDMPPATRNAAAALSVLKDEYKDWSNALAADTMPVVTHSMAIFQAMLPRLTPLVKGTSKELDHMLAVIAGGVQSNGFARFMDQFAEFASGSLAKATNGMVRFSQALDSGAVSSDVNKFMDYVRANGPLVGETLGNLGRAVTHLLVAASDAGVGMLQLVNALGKLVAGIPTGVLSSLLQLYAGMKLLKLGIAGVTAVTTSSAVAGLSNFVRAARFGGVGNAINGVAQRMTTLQKAAGALGILGAVAVGINYLAEKARGAPPDVDRLTSSLKTLSATGKWTGELKSTFGDMDGFVSKLGKLKVESAAMEKAKPFLAFSGLGPFADTVVTKLDDLTRGTKSLGATKDDFKSYDQALAGMATNGYAKQAAEQFRGMKAAWVGSGRSLKEFNSAFPGYRSAVAGLKAEQKLAAQGMGLFGQQAVDTGNKLAAQKASADGLRASIQALNDVNRAGLGGMIGFEAAIDAAGKAAKENRDSLHMVNGELDLNSPKAQAAASGLMDLAAKTDAAATSAREAHAPWEKVNGIYSEGRAEIVKWAQVAGLGKEQAEKFADSVLKIPNKKDFKVKMNAEDAIADLDTFIGKVKKTPDAKSVKMSAITKVGEQQLEALGYKVTHMKDGSVRITAPPGQAVGDINKVKAARDALKGKSVPVDAKTGSFWTRINALAGKVLGTSYINVAYRKVDSSASPRFSARGGPMRLAGGGTPGGRIAGPGTSTSDSIPAMLSDGEWVIRAAAVSKYGDQFMAAVNSGRYRPAGFAKGGKLTAKQKAAAEAEKARQKEGKSALTSDVTFTTGGKLAGYKNTETVHDLGMPESVSSLVSSINSYLSNIKKAFTGSTEKNLVAKMTASGKALLDNQKKLEANNKALDAAKSTLDDLKGKFDSLKTSVSSSLVGFGNVTKIGKYGTSADTLIKQLQSDTTRTTEFASQLEQLKSKGLNATAISDIASAGVTGGGMATAQSLLTASPEQIAKINELQAQLQKSSDAAGTTAANAMYGAGLKAAEGLVKGLTAQQSKIEAAMMAIAKSMEAAIKKALGIKSPAKRMEPVGDFAFRGVEVGWTKRLAKGNTLLSGSAAGMRVRPSYAAVAPGASTPAMPGAPVVHLTVNVSSTDLMSNPAERRRVAVTLAKETNDALLNYQKARRR